MNWQRFFYLLCELKLTVYRPAGNKKWKTPATTSRCSRRSGKIVYCATRGENELFLARVRCGARVGVEGAEGARDGTSAEDTSTESEIAFLPKLHTVFFLTKAWKGLFYVCESERIGHFEPFTTQLKFSFLT